MSTATILIGLGAFLACAVEMVEALTIVLGVEHGARLALDADGAVRVLRRRIAMLRPIVEAAGIARRRRARRQRRSCDRVPRYELAEDAAKSAIWLRTEPEPANKKDDSIYRYDRAGLLMALKSAGSGRGK